MLQTCAPHELRTSKSERIRSRISSHSISSIPPRLLTKKSFAYHKMSQQTLNLSVIKLDGSTFEVQVSRMATVAKLIEAVKDVFDQSANDDEVTFLCYNGKIFDYKAHIRLTGIKDGDQLRLVRHLSANAYEKRGYDIL